MAARIKRAAFDATATVTENSDEGTFEALVAVFGNVDSQGDIIDAGAFTNTLEAWAEKGQPIPIVWSHMWEDPFAHLGGVVKAEETEAGLKIVGQLDLSNPTAAQVYKLMKAGRVTQFSFVASSPEDGYSMETLADGSTVWHLKELDLIEVGPTLRGANTETALISIKADFDARVAKDGGLLTLSLTHIKDQLTEILGAVNKASPPGNGNEDTSKASETPGPFVLPAARAKAIALLIGKDS
ncbi:HK97 family phage prohead protease [Cryobacterium sp. AP23]